MSNRKRGFVFYFDNILAVESLPPDQRGWLLSALCSYADRVWQDTSVGIEEVLDLYPQLSQQASVACRFLAAGVLRDTQKWLTQQELRTRRREQQGRAPLAARPASPAQDSAQSLERYRQDVELARWVWPPCGGRPVSRAPHPPLNFCGPRCGGPTLYPDYSGMVKVNWLLPV